MAQAARARHTPGGFVRWSANGAGDLGFTARDARTGARRRRGKPNGERRGRGRRLTRAAREATAGCPPMRDERGVRASAKVPRTGARRRGTRGAAGSGAGASARALDKAAASRMREVTWDTCFSAIPAISFALRNAPASPRSSSRSLVALSQDALAVHSRNRRARRPVIPAPATSLRRHSRESGNPVAC